LKRLQLHPVFWLFLCLAAFGLLYAIWSPGQQVRDGRHDLRTNGIWAQHGWLGDDSWFSRNKRDKALFRDDGRLRHLADLLRSHGILYVFPHLCPCSAGGMIAPNDSSQTERFLDHFGGFGVLPWIGGVLDVHCFLKSEPWRSNFVSSVTDLLKTHPRLAGVHLNIEPMPSGNRDFLSLLHELRNSMQEGKILSVAAYPPPTRWHPHPSVHWDEAYFKEVAQCVDQLAPMMYDTAIFLSKPYRHVMAAWTQEVLDWAGTTQVLLGVPAYNDKGVLYHFPHVENLHNALWGIHGGLSDCKSLPLNYAGIAIYCEWEMGEAKWEIFRKDFEQKMDLSLPDR